MGTTELLNLLLTTTVHTPPRPRDSPFAAVAVVIPGSRIPDWIRYQSSENVIEADLPLNWSTNCLGFALALVFSSPSTNFWFKARVFLEFGTCCHAIDTESISPYSYEGDHVLLNYVAVQPSLSPHQVIHIKATFEITSLYEMKRCGLGLMYVNEEVNCNNVPPPNESTLVLKEISAGEPIECEDMTITRNKWKPQKFYRICLWIPLLLLDCFSLWEWLWE